MKITYYVLGFLFSQDLSRVLLIRKNRPQWQAGLLNGIGGHIDTENESSLEAMIREFREETGITTEDLHWHGVAVLNNDLKGWNVACYAASDARISAARTTTDEEILEVPSSDVHTLLVVSNLRWLVPLAREFLYGLDYGGGKISAVEATYAD